ncbi:hypothetical protein TNCV_4685501 [Trichonephila clavipes]|nr:hypothetical protein TNCV_4685501 [Trichonephila clavipes]
MSKKSHGIPSSPRAAAAAVAKFRLLTGHDCLCAHLFRFNLVTSPICVLCDTGQDMTAAHLDECSALNDLNCIVKRKSTILCARVRFEVFRSLHNLSRPGIRATKRLIQDHFVWPSMLKDIAKWTRCCILCQRSKVQRHTVSPIQPFAPTVERFQHVHIDLVGPFPPSDGFTFLLTCIDRYTRWLEVIPVSDISAEALEKSFIANWISRFGVPAIITTDQGSQF